MPRDLIDHLTMWGFKVFDLKAQGIAHSPGCIPRTSPSATSVAMKSQVLVALPGGQSSNSRQVPASSVPMVGYLGRCFFPSNAVWLPPGRSRATLDGAKLFEVKSKKGRVTLFFAFFVCNSLSTQENSCGTPS